MRSCWVFCERSKQKVSKYEALKSPKREVPFKVPLFWILRGLFGVCFLSLLVFQIEYTVIIAIWFLMSNNSLWKLLCYVKPLDIVAICISLWGLLAYRVISVFYCCISITNYLRFKILCTHYFYGYSLSCFALF